MINKEILEPLDEVDFLEQLFDLDGKHILELGCGLAEKTRLIATNGKDRTIIATEVDEIQHQHNLLIEDLPNVIFILAGSESIPYENDSFDIVFMFKSFHHVPKSLMDIALTEVHRIMKPGGLLYISEPVFAGDFNDILRLFHDEQEVRHSAINAINKSIQDQKFIQMGQYFFDTKRAFKNFAEFEGDVIEVTHNSYQLSPKIHHDIKKLFATHCKENGAIFLTPNRVDLLQKIIP